MSCTDCCGCIESEVKNKNTLGIIHKWCEDVCSFVLNLWQCLWFLLVSK